MCGLGKGEVDRLQVQGQYGLQSEVLKKKKPIVNTEEIMKEYISLSFLLIISFRENG